MSQLRKPPHLSKARVVQRAQPMRLGCGVATRLSSCNRSSTPHCTTLDTYRGRRVQLASGITPAAQQACEVAATHGRYSPAGTLIALPQFPLRRTMLGRCKARNNTGNGMAHRRHRSMYLIPCRTLADRTEEVTRIHHAARVVPDIEARCVGMVRGPVDDAVAAAVEIRAGISVDGGSLYTMTRPAVLVIGMTVRCAVAVARPLARSVDGRAAPAAGRPGAPAPGRRGAPYPRRASGGCLDVGPAGSDGAAGDCCQRDRDSSRRHQGRRSVGPSRRGSTQRGLVGCLEDHGGIPTRLGARRVEEENAGDITKQSYLHSITYSPLHNSWQVTEVNGGCTPVLLHHPSSRHLRSHPQYGS